MKSFLVSPIFLVFPVVLLAAPCPRYPAGSSITQPQDLFSEHGVLRVDFTYETRVDQNGNTLFCFMTQNGVESPTLHVRPGDRLVIKLKNNVPAPAIVTTQGSVEDWTIENRTLENHEFHIHQIHFLGLEQSGVPVNNGQYLDTIQVPYWSGTGPYPSVKVRMDFRGPLVGDFVYHCHILGHEDGSMMAIIRVKPAHPERGHR